MGGLSDFVKKIHDPFGHKKKIRKKTGISDALEFEKFNLKRMWDMVREDPERLLFGSADPFSTKMWNKALGRDDDPMINQWGGPTQQAFMAAEEAGIDTSSAQGLHQVAQMIASIYAGGAAAQGLGGLGIGGGGATAAPGSMAAGAPGADLLASGMTKTGMAASGAMQGQAQQLEEDFPPEVKQALIQAGYPIRGLTAGLPGMAEGGHMNYARGGQPKEMTNPREMMASLAQISQVPGGQEVLMSAVAEELTGKKQGTRQLRLFNMGGHVGYQGGGLANAAEMTRAGGRGDDDVLLHLSPEEFEAIEAMWGKAPINPETGIPEYGFLSDLWKGIKKTVKKIVKSPVFSFLAPIALNTFFPGAGAALGKFLGAGSGAMGARVGNALIRGGLGAASGGKEGALSGALSSLTMGGGETIAGDPVGGLGGDIGAKLGLEGKAAEMAGNAIMGGIGGEIGGGGFAQGALGNVANAMMMQPIEEGVGKAMGQIFKPGQGELPDLGVGTTGQMSPVPGGAPQLSDIGAPIQTGAMSPIASGTSAPVASGNILTRGMDWIKDNPGMALAGAGMLGSMGSGGSQSGDGPPQLPDDFLQGIPLYDFDRQRTGLPSDLYYTYGIAGGPQEGEFNYFTDNTIGQPVDPNAPPGGAIPRGGPPGVGPVPGGPGGGGRRRPAGGRRALPEYDDYYAQESMAGLDPIYGVPSGQPLSDEQIAFLNQDYGTGGGPVSRMLLRLQAEARERAGWNTPTGYATGGYATMPAMPKHLLMHEGHMTHLAAGGYAGNNYPREGYAGAGYARGAGSGRDDTIEALLSDGEYVMDAETVAMLGDGSNEAGAKRLDELRNKLRKHKGRALAKGKFSPDAKHPMQYLKKGGKVTEGKVKKIAKKVADKKMDEHIRYPAPKGHGSGKRGGQRQRKRYKKGGSVRNPLMHARLARIAAEQGEE